jgi:C_GCAxxG_C_C family probable redox protein
MSKQIRDRAIQSFRGGLNCAQAVVSAFSEELKYDNSMALSVSCGFGAGMGRLQETCGAVTGSFMVLGMVNCRKFTDNKDRKEVTYDMIRKFSDKFKQIHGTTDCSSLLNCDLKTEDGHRFAIENKLFGTVCENCISDSIGILEELIA